MKILKIWSTFQTELKYHDHYLSEVMQFDGHITSFLASDKIEKEYLPFLKDKDMVAGDDIYIGSKILRLKSFEFMNKPFIIECKKMYNELCQQNYDIIHIFGISNPITMMTLIFLKICKNKVPVVINDHSNPNLKSSSIIGKLYYQVNIFLFQKLSKDVDLIITPNLASKIFIYEQYGIKKEKIITIPLGYDDTIFKYEKDIKNTNRNLVIGFAGKVLPGKKLELLIDTLSKLSNLNITCEIIGMNLPETVYQQSLRRYAKEKEVEIMFRPLIKDAKLLSKFYNFIDVAVFPGSISITTLEANGCGTPIILHESIDGLEDRVEHGRGVLFKRNLELKEYLIKYNEMKKQKVIDNCSIATASKIYSWKEISKLYLMRYSELINNFNSEHNNEN